MKNSGIKLDALNPNSIETIENYTREIEQFRNSEQIEQMPALNQDRLLTNLLRTFNSSYPHNLMTGDTGIGKTVMSDFILNSFKDEESFKHNLSLLNPEQQNLMNSMRTKLEQHQNQDQLFLANFESQNVVQPFSYSDNEQFRKDSELLEESALVISEYVNFFAPDNQELLIAEGEINKGRPKFKSDKVFQTFMTGLNETIENEQARFEPDSQIHKWFDSMKNHFQRQKKDFTNSLLNVYTGITMYNKVKIKGTTAQGESEELNLEEFLQTPVEVLTDDATEEGYSLKQIREYFNITTKFTNFNFPIESLLAPNPKESQPQTTIAKAVILGNEGIQSSFGTVYQQIQSNQTVLAPHFTVSKLGPIFDGSIIYIKDGFKEFLETSAYQSNRAKEKYLTFLETGEFEAEVGDLLYKVNLPKMTLASDNQDPFLRVESSYKETREEGLEARITEHRVPSYTANTKTARENTVKIMLDTIESLNKQHKKKIEIDSESLDQILQNLKISDTLISTKYRDLTKAVEKIYQYVNSNNQNEINVQILKDLTLEQQDDAFFMAVDADCNNYEYKKIPSKDIGFVNGTCVVGESGSAIGIRTNIVLGRGPAKPDERLRLVDLETGNGDKSTHKGFILASEYLTNFLSQIEDKDLLEKFNWQTLTHFYKLHGGLGGDSASTAIATSIISELAQIPVYKNRFVTGTLEPNGVVGVIGGVYQKATAPYRVSELTGKEQHFIFPGSNLKELEQKLVLDPYNIKEKVSLIPVDNFNQAFEIMTNSNPTNEVIRNSQQLGTQTLDKAIINIEKRLKQEYKPKKFFSFR